jgi:hypothetical protein
VGSKATKMLQIPYLFLKKKDEHHLQTQDEIFLVSHSRAAVVVAAHNKILLRFLFIDTQT